MTDEERLLRHFHDLAGKAYAQDRPIFTGFLNEAEQSLLLTHADEFSYCGFALFGGTQGCQRQMACFAPAEDTAYPIACIKIEPKQQKFADLLTHRDFLGAVMHLGLERECVGDILVKDNLGMLFCTQSMAAYIAENIDSVRHTAVRCTVMDKPPEEMLFKLEEQLSRPPVSGPTPSSRACSVYRAKKPTRCFLPKKLPLTPGSLKTTAISSSRAMSFRFGVTANSFLTESFPFPKKEKATAGYGFTHSKQPFYRLRAAQTAASTTPSTTATPAATRAIVAHGAWLLT